MATLPKFQSKVKGGWTLGKKTILAWLLASLAIRYTQWLASLNQPPLPNGTSVDSNVPSHLKSGSFAQKFARKIKNHLNKSFGSLNVSLHLWSTQIKLFSIQLNPLALKYAFCTLNPLKSGPLEFKCTFPPSNHSKQAFFNSNASLYSKYIQFRPFSTQCAIATSNYSK